MKSQNSTDTPFNLVLEEDEKITWSGRPDMQAVVNTAYPGSRRLNKYAALALVCWIVYALWNQAQGQGLAYDWRLLVLTGITALGFFYSAIHAKNKLMQWMENLSYAITNQRVIILRDGTVENEYSQRDVMQASLIPRKGVPGFSDVIWAKKVNKTYGRRHGFPTPLKQEKLLTGFKALADSEGVMQILDDWVAEEETSTHLEDAAFFDGKMMGSEKDKGANEETKSTSSEKLVSPVHGFSVEFPSSWKITSRYRKLAFGKWGIEREAVWSTPAEKPKWNVIRGQNESRTHVEIQVQKVAPFNTLESIMDTSKAASFLGTGEVIDHDPSIVINGIPGFYVTRKCGNPDSILPSQIQEKLAYWHMRQYILHDGTYQYFIEAMWPAENPEQLKTCEVIIATLNAS
jgi:hypothetical protein